jgi:DNA (cytosine-5)-methyltransferase 1
MKVLELFAGIGSCSKALKNLGIKVDYVDVVEIDKYAIKSFNVIHNTNYEPQDITEWNKNIEDIDLIMHGSPCQDFSIAGKQAGGDLESGTRSSLMYETIRIVGQTRPKYVVWENVKNVLSKKHKHNFDRYIETLNTLGYNSYYQVLNAKDYGIPQNRERVFTISIRKDIDDGKFGFPEKQELKLRLKDMLEDEVDEKYFIKKTLNLQIGETKVSWDNSGKGYNSQQDRAYYQDGLCPALSYCNTNGDKSQIVLSDKNEVLDERK